MSDSVWIIEYFHDGTWRLSYQPTCSTKQQVDIELEYSRRKSPMFAYRAVEYVRKERGE